MASLIGSKSKSLKSGDRVITPEGREMGRVTEIGDTCFRIGTKGKRAFWLPKEAIGERRKGILSLSVGQDQLDETQVRAEEHRGAHSHDHGGGPRLAPMSALLALGITGAVALKDRQRRQKLMSTTRGLVDKVKSRSSGSGSPQAFLPPPNKVGNTMPAAMNSTPSTPPAPQPEPARSTSVPETLAVGPNVPVDGGPEGPRTNDVAADMAKNSSGNSGGARPLTTKEEAVVARVTQAFPERDLRVAPMTVHRQDGGDSDTLRFTLDEAYSTDIKRDRLERAGESPEAVAEEIIVEIREGLPPGDDRR